MDVQVRRHRTVRVIHQLHQHQLYFNKYIYRIFFSFQVQNHDQENFYATKKVNLLIPSKRQGLSVRGALGEINTNVEIHREVNVGKGTNASAELEKKLMVKRGVR